MLTGKQKQEINEGNKRNRDMNPLSFSFVTNKMKQLLYLLMAIQILYSCKSDQDTEYSILKGSFRQSIIETGELEAINAITISMPRINYIYGYNFKIIDLAEHGKNVQKGEPVIVIDPASVQKFIIEKRESLENEIASANKLKAEIINNIQDLKAQIRNEQALYDIKKLQAQSSAFESAGLKKVMELEFRQAEIRLEKLQRKLELKPKLDSLDYLIQQIKIIQKENELKAAEETLKQMTVYSPLDGIFVTERNWRTGQQIRVGDEVYLGNPVAKIPDIRTMKVNGIIRENDISMIKTGQDVIVRLDALPSVPFKGKISKLGKVCVERDGKNVFLTEVLIAESDPRLKPGMTVSCEYIIFESDEEIYVPNSCIKEENRHFYVFLKRGGKIRKTEVRTGPSNNMYTVINGSVRPGQKLAIPDNVLTLQNE